MLSLREAAATPDLMQNLKVFSAMNQGQAPLTQRALVVKVLNVMVRIPADFSVACQVLFFLRLLFQQHRRNSVYYIDKLQKCKLKAELVFKLELQLFLGQQKKINHLHDG